MLLKFETFLKTTWRRPLTVSRRYFARPYVRNTRVAQLKFQQRVYNNLTILDVRFYNTNVNIDVNTNISYNKSLSRSGLPVSGHKVNRRRRHRRRAENISPNSLSFSQHCILHQESGQPPYDSLRLFRR